MPANLSFGEMALFQRVMVSSLLLAVVGVMPAMAQDAGVLGFWRSPGGSVLRIAHCGGEVCATVVAISKTAPATVDGNNPDKSLRTRSICNLQIGSGFKLQDANHAEDGKIYDPENGKTYKGSMTAEGNTLNLRGFIGFKAFGRSEMWTRTEASQGTCR